MFTAPSLVPCGPLVLKRRVFLISLEHVVGRNLVVIACLVIDVELGAPRGGGFICVAFCGGSRAGIVRGPFLALGLLVPEPEERTGGRPVGLVEREFEDALTPGLRVLPALDRDEAVADGDAVLPLPFVYQGNGRLVVARAR